MEYVSPATGLGIKDINLVLKKPLIKNVKKGDVVSLSMFKKMKKISSKEIKFCKKHKVTLPVRKHDVDKIRKEFSTGRYEFHLSYSEVDSGLNKIMINPNEEYSIHLPDYIGPNHLIDPFGEPMIKKRSEFILNSSFEFAKKIQNLTGKTCPVVGSFSVNNFSKEIFYEKISNFCLFQKKNDITLLPQWLPPIAWYFGGSVKLAVFNNSDDIKFLQKFKIPICFDTAHFLMCLNSGNVKIKSDLDRLLSITKHLHISGAEGLDGEGTAINIIDENTKIVFKKCLNLNKMKVIETWQGHLDNFYGFRKSITDLFKFKSRMQIDIFIQARMGSTRMPGKVLEEVNGIPILVRTYNRIRRCDLAKNVAIIASTNKKDDQIENVCKKYSLPLFRGSEEDLLDRHYKAALFYGSEYVFKIPSDCPFSDVEIINKVLKMSDKFDYVSNYHPPTFPDGLDVEGAQFKILQNAWKFAKKKHEREHTFPFIWDNPDKYKIGNLLNKKGNMFIIRRWTIDYPEDMKFIKEVYKKFSYRDYFGFEEILDLLKTKPEISKINSKYNGINWYRNEKII